MMKYTMFFLGCMLYLSSCQTKYNLIDTGVANGVHDCTMYDYFKLDAYNWSMTLEMIDRGGLDSLFQGLDANHPQITFIGITNLSIQRWMYNTLRVDSVSQIDSAVCRATILRYVVDTAYMVKDIARGSITTTAHDGGNNVVGLGGNAIWMYTQQDPYQNVANTGPVRLYVYSTDKSMGPYVIASTDIQTNTGTVQALAYNFNIPGL